MKHFILLTLLFCNTLYISAQEQLVSKYSGIFASTITEYTFLDSNRFYLQREGHLGDLLVKGDYKISNDTIYLTFDENNTDYPHYTNQLIIDGDSFIIDIYSMLDFCNEKDYGKVGYRDGKIINYKYISKERAIKYPQIPTSNSKEEAIVKNALNKIFEDKPVKKYLRQQNIRFRKRVALTTYYEIDFKDTKHIRINGQPSIILNEKEITDKVYVKINDINLNPEDLFIQLTIHTDGYKGEFSETTESRWEEVFDDIEVSEYLPDEAIEKIEKEEIPRQKSVSEVFYYYFTNPIFSIDSEWIMESWQ